MSKLKKLREDTRDYVLAQMQAKAERKDLFQNVKDAQGGILLGDAVSKVSFPISSCIPSWGVVLVCSHVVVHCGDAPT